MPGFKSDLTNKNFPARQFREIEVPDETGHSPQTFEATNEDVDFDAFNALMRSRGMPDLDPKIEAEYYARKQQQPPQRNLKDVERQVADAKKAKFSGQEKLSPSAKQRIEMLLGTSRMFKEVDIDGHRFVLRNLKGKEQRSIMMVVAEFERSVEFPFELRRQVLARALVEVAGTDIDLFLNNTSLDSKLEFIEELDDVVINRLYGEYLLLAKEAEEKYALKTENEVKEVSEDLKK